MPRISEFHGIVIAMYYSDHAPPHFHAASGGAEASLLIETLEILEGSLPGRVVRLVVRWGRIHQAALVANWERARRGEALDKIPPLE